MPPAHMRFRHTRGGRFEIADATRVSFIIKMRHHVTSHVGAFAKTRVLGEVADLAFVVEQATRWDFLVIFKHLIIFFYTMFSSKNITFWSDSIDSRTNGTYLFSSCFKLY